MLGKLICSMGLDLVNGTIRNNLEAGVIEPAMSKVKIIQVKSTWLYMNYIIKKSSHLLNFKGALFCDQFATEAAITILRIDDMIKLVKDESQGEE